ncbi:major outer membrane protein FomA [Fusobacterium polymorphum]
MKKLALVLGSLLVVGSVASAKEVMPAPTPAPEKVVEYVEKPVIVYRDREVTPAWRPNGSVDVQYKWYGETENKVKGENAWANPDNNNAGRLQTLTKVNFTEKQSLEVRTRNYHTLRSEKSNADSDQVRLRHFYNFGNLGSSKVNATSRLEYKQSNGDLGKKHAEASVFFDFADYIFSNNFFKADKFGFRAGYEHNWAGHTSGVDGQKFSKGSNNRAILNFESAYTLPLGFSAELNVYNGYDWHNKKFGVVNKEDKKHAYYGSMEAYIYQHTPLYKNDSVELSFDFEGGYDPYTWHQYKIIDNDGDRRTYQVYMLPTLQIAYKPTEFVKLYAAGGAEYRNWAIDAESKAKDWRWQPTAWAGMKVTF